MAAEHVIVPLSGAVDPKLLWDEGSLITLDARANGGEAQMRVDTLEPGSSPMDVEAPA
jgi:hypothetical protein